MKKIILFFTIILCSVLSQAQIHTINFPLLLKKVSAAAPGDSVLTIGLDGIVTLVKRADLPISIATQQALSKISLTPGPQGLKGETGLQGPAGSDANVPDANIALKGKIRLAGDLAGTADAPIVPALAGKAPLTGIGTSGTWPIDISGHAGSATNATQFGGIGYEGGLLNTAAAAMLYNPTTSKWAAGTRADLQRLSGLNTGAVLDNTATGWGNATTAAQYDGNGTTGVNTFLMGYNVDGKWSPKSRPAVQAFLNVNDGSALNNNISGNSATATSWGGIEARLTTLTGAVNGVLVKDVDAVAKIASNDQIKSWLGIPTAGLSLQDVTKVNYTTNTPIRSGPGYYVTSSGPDGGFLWQESNAPLRFGTNNYEAVRIHANGSVGIGYISDRGYKLAVNGNSFFAGDLQSIGQAKFFGASSRTPTLGTWNGVFGIASPAGDFGLELGVTPSGDSFIQAHRADGTPTAYDILLQPSGGNVISNGDISAPNFFGKAEYAGKIDNGSEQMAFEWEDGVTQPTWLWGAVEADKANVYNPASLTVGTAINWGGKRAALNTSVSDARSIVMIDYDGVAKIADKATGQNFLDLNDGTTLNNNISGSAASVPWEGITGKPAFLSNTNQLANEADFLRTTALQNDISKLMPQVSFLTSGTAGINHYTMDQTFICGDGIDIMFPDAADWNKSTPGMKITLRGINKSASFNMYSAVSGQLETDQFGVFAGGYTEPGGRNTVYIFVSDGAKWRRIR